VRPTSFTYDLVTGRPSRVSKPEGALNYEYNTLGQLSKVWTSGAENQGLSQGSEATGWTVPAFPYYEYFYDSAGRLVQAKFSSGVAEYDYYVNGSRKSLTLPNKVKTEYTFDALMHLDCMEHRDSEETLLASFDYTVGISGKRASVFEMIDSATANWDYTYDGLDRLATAARGISGGTTTTIYTYDVVGNRMSMTRGGIETTYEYTALDQLESETVSGATTEYFYDGNGNLSQKDTGTKVTNYVYDSRNRLREVYEGETIQANLTLEYAYDFAGSRFAKAARNGSNDFTRSTFLIDNNNLTGYSQTFLKMDYDTGEVSRRHEYGDDLYCQVDNPSSQLPAPSYFLYDGLGTTRALINNSQAITQSYNYQPFGEGINHPAEPATTHLFTGEYFDNDLGYYYLRARYYDPRAGRFTGFDPADDYANNLHKYAYCGNDGINNMDPSGQMIIWPGWSVALKIIGKWLGIAGLGGIICYTAYKYREKRFEMSGDVNTNAKYKDIVEKAIDLMEQTGAEEAADRTRDLLEDGRIKFDCYNYLNNIINRWFFDGAAMAETWSAFTKDYDDDYILLSMDLLDGGHGSMYSSDQDYLDIAWIATILVHEDQHRVNYFTPDEPHAYTIEGQYLDGIFRSNKTPAISAKIGNSLNLKKINSWLTVYGITKEQAKMNGVIWTNWTNYELGDNSWELKESSK